VEPAKKGAGNFDYTSGSNTAKRTERFYDCKDSGTVTYLPVLGVADVWSFGFRKAKPGESGYPSIFIYRAVKGAFGLWRSDDYHLTWVNLSDKFINNSQDQVRVVEGDNNVYGMVYIGFSGSGFAYRVLLQ
jgi:hypothetical protein